MNQMSEALSFKVSATVSKLDMYLCYVMPYTFPASVLCHILAFCCIEFDLNLHCLLKQHPRLSAV